MLYFLNSWVWVFELKQKSIAEPGALDEFRGNSGAPIYFGPQLRSPAIWSPEPRSPKPLWDLEIKTRYFKVITAATGKYRKQEKQVSKRNISTSCERLNDTVHRKREA